MAHHTETLTGLTTIRTYAEVLQLSYKVLRLVDENNTPYFCFLMAQRWIALRGEMAAEVNPDTVSRLQQRRRSRRASDSMLKSGKSKANNGAESPCGPMIQNLNLRFAPELPLELRGG
ncbi:hypothetical protein BJ742DRAFT_770182 [Cladochytrium replicatum]|nr:hypothetical protein BJ742DRAFT_770182 [Cladochytrium replicatum]